MAQLIASESQKTKKLSSGGLARPVVSSGGVTGGSGSGSGSLGGGQAKETREQVRLKRIEQLAKLCGQGANDAAVYLFAGNKHTPTYTH